MKVKHVLMIAAILLAMLVMPVVATGSETDNSDTSAETEPPKESELTLGIPSTYEVTIPKTIDFKAGAIISASDVIIGHDAALVVTVSSGNVWNLTLTENDRMKYQMFVGEKTTAAQNGDEVLKIASPANGDAVKLTFKTDDVAKKSGDYKDTLTFTVEEVPDVGAGVNSKVLVISDLEDLQNFRDDVNSGNSYKGWTVKLLDNIDLNDEEWTPIGTSSNTFQGTFDGQGYTISNLYINQPDKSNIGLFGYTTNGEIKNLIIENAKVTGYLEVGVVAGTPYTSKYSYITVKGHVEVDGFAYVGGVGGKSAYAHWTEITVEVDDTSYVKAYSINEAGTAYRSYVGGVIGFMGEGGHTFKNVVSNIDVTGSTIDVGGITGIAHYGNSFINCHSSGAVTITNAAEAADVEEMGGIAGVWHNGGADVTFDGCSFTGTLDANIVEGVDLSDNTIHGAAYSETGTGKLVCDCCTQNTEGTGQEEESTP